MTPDQSLARALDEHVTLAPYDPCWPAAFDVERDRLLGRFGARIIDIRHFGSTAVPGLEAKPVIDLIAGVGSVAQADDLVPELCGFGYHFPVEGNAGLAHRRWLFRHFEGHRTHQLHLVAHGGPAWRAHLAFCDLLNADPALRGRYEVLKRALAGRFSANRDAYDAYKQAFILSALANAGPDARSLPYLPCPVA